MITLTREEAQQVHDALLNFEGDISDAMFAALTTFRARLAQPEPEPVAWEYCGALFYDKEEVFAWHERGDIGSTPPKPLYSAPPQQEKQEPVAWMNEGDIGKTDWKVWAHGKPTATIPLYTAECTPMVRTTTPEDIAKIKSKWVGLTEIDEYERGFIDGMQKQMQSSVDKAVNKMAQREWQGLTDDERTYLAWESNNGSHCVAMTEAMLKEKNSAT